ncbi:hypothetical protein PMIN01_07153 [Paraphaeosphaeria minitans]|uniref:Uncharacterized protein n=1 Tax=Paraphaeosphaeria minitans TaxID=565426 RepID=A0A9P6GFV9_9PLEO|nr:hypothetical protein PMIN01_07153 [Paraphaeosphaeria minitans]
MDAAWERPSTAADGGRRTESTVAGALGTFPITSLRDTERIFGASLVLCLPSTPDLCTYRTPIPPASFLLLLVQPGESFVDGHLNRKKKTRAEVFQGSASRALQVLSFGKIAVR